MLDGVGEELVLGEEEGEVEGQGGEGGEGGWGKVGVVTLVDMVDTVITLVVTLLISMVVSIVVTNPTTAIPIPASTPIILLISPIHITLPLPLFPFSKPSNLPLQEPLIQLVIVLDPQQPIQVLDHFVLLLVVVLVVTGVERRLGVE